MTVNTAPVHHLELAPLGEGAWRLRDRSISEDDDGTLIAYVERLPGGSYETVWVFHSPGVEIFGALEDVLIAASRRLSLAAMESKPVPIPHLQPLSFR